MDEYLSSLEAVINQYKAYHNYHLFIPEFLLDSEFDQILLEVVLEESLRVL